MSSPSLPMVPQWLKLAFGIKRALGVHSHTAEALNVKKEPVKLTVSTITSITKVVSSPNSENIIKLPAPVPANRSHIPTSTTATLWPDLEYLEHEMSPELDYEVGLLIVYNCPQALLPRDVISAVWTSHTH